MSVIVRTAIDLARNIGASAEHLTNRLLPPRQRERALESLRAFAVRNPKLASFLAAQTALAGLPVLLFLAFAVATLVVSLVTFLLLGIVAALSFTLFTTGLALFLVIPIVFIGSCTASIAFLCGLFGYLFLQKINYNENSVPPDTKVDNACNELTRGILLDSDDRANKGLQQEYLAVSPLQNKIVPVGSHSVDQGHDAYSFSPRRRYHDKSDNTDYGAGIHEEDVVGHARGPQPATLGVRASKSEQPQNQMTTSGPAHGRVVDWKMDLQQDGITA